MIRAAGIVFLTPDNLVLMLKRGPGSDHPGKWCFPGGQWEEGETIEETAKRETVEEIGFLPKGDRVSWTRRIASDTEGVEVDFTTFLQRVDEQFIPKVNGEHTGWAWVLKTEPPLPIHPGCAVALRRLDMDELGIAEAIRDGDLISPQIYENVMLVALRVTGTGAAYRHKHEEYVWRDPSLYLNERFLKRCNGLTVILEHPKGAVLTSKEYNNRAVGSIMLPYIKGDEVWAICRIHDHEAAVMIANHPISTSPAVVWRDPDKENDKVLLENGETLLIEGKPSLLDHLAICSLGVWDKGGAPSGAQQDTVRGDSPPPLIISPWALPAVVEKIDVAIARLRCIEIDGLSRRLIQ